MLDFFTIFSKGGIVLWCFQGTGVTESFTGPVNALIRSVILQERSGNNSFNHEALSLKYKLDNEFELIFVVGFQKILTLTYVDKFIDDVQLHFRDRYKNELEQKGAMKLLNHSFEFEDDFKMLLREAEKSSKARSPAPMRSFKESEKSQKTVKSMIETKGGDKGKEQGGKKSKNTKKEAPVAEVVKEGKAQFSSGQKLVENGNHGLTPEEIMQKKREEFFRKCAAGPAEKVSKSPKPQKPREKQRRVWDMGGSSTKDLDYSDRNGDSSPNGGDQNQDALIEPGMQLSSMKGDLLSVECDSSEEEVMEEEERVAVNAIKKSSKKSGGFGGMFGMLKGLVGSKSLSLEDMEPVLEKMREHLIAKNVAADIALQLCDSVAKKLEGKVMGTFTTVASTVKQALQDSLVQILQPKRRVDILRDVMEAQSQRRPFVITFCGVNGVGKSTNLAKISFWLVENGFTVLIAACDTFRAGAVEQLRTHQRRLNSLHPPERHGGRTMVQLYEKGYGKDAAGIAMEAIAYARNQAFDVVLVDTAGRMQDNAPLMTALAKLIAVNMPDLVLFVGEALVGNEAVDQLVKFNQALADHSMSDKPRLIDGIVLTKFDTIDDKVGAAISMTYITGQPIVFVGTGQTYNDLRSLNARAVVSALMKA
ncbi:signal recognition particle receptor subunit alpha [Dunckerocampus dactyliophorus]|uniref:signal recognition particle receptor subunit alpha n=1 Tax=Dunckerocampus dactyliophorus TaxID=161453 RepID=UPI0024074933|nr:signal recognition particle receptor subunit alpha [Dunckerocampus dactyliophorus]XP_054650127.1 signal recognition particle receptor subunit alpha [Dunckerocampus dactyliophorus]